MNVAPSVAGTLNLSGRLALVKLNFYIHVRPAGPALATRSPCVGNLFRLPGKPTPRRKWPTSSRKNSQFTLKLSALASGTVVVLTVSARNATGESGPGNAVEIAVP